MTTSKYSRPNEVIVSASEAIAMMQDDSLIVIMAIPDASEELVDVMYWSKDDGAIPPWIVVKKAA